MLRREFEIRLGKFVRGLPSASVTAARGRPAREVHESSIASDRSPEHFAPRLLPYNDEAVDRLEEAHIL